MNPPRPFLKIVILSTFILLLSGFIAYRSGAFDKMLSGKKNSVSLAENNAALTNQPDTIPKADSVPKKPTIMSSSKSMVIADDYEYIVKDGKLKKKLKKKKSKTDTAATKPVTIFSGSKSGPMVTPKVAPDTAKKKQQPNQ